jgi:hypothetical protein
MDSAALDLPVTDIAYMAGLFDGEGTICISHAKAQPPRHPSPVYELRVAVQMNSEVTVRAFFDCFGGHVAPHRPPQFVWSARAWRAIRVLNTLKPFLRLKRAQADLALHFMETKTLGYRRGRYRVAPKLLAERQAIYEQMGLLNNSHWYRSRHQDDVVQGAK